MEDLIRLQHSDGHWEFSSEFSAIISKQEKDWSEFIEVKQDSEKATLLALAFLNTFFVTLQDEWHILAGKFSINIFPNKSSEKAKMWLQNKLNISEKEIVHLIQRVQKLVL